jgi:hypothetical protein
MPVPGKVLDDDPTPYERRTENTLWRSQIADSPEAAVSPEPKTQDEVPPGPGFSTEVHVIQR